jgi:hypothetical protein
MQFTHVANGNTVVSVTDNREVNPTGERAVQQQAKVFSEQPKRMFWKI